MSVVVPHYERQGALDRTLAALAAQSYPHELVEVIVVADGSRTPPRIPAGSGLDITVLEQARRGFGAARARNAGARAAKHDILVFLDCDIVAERRLLQAHARWHHAVSDALTLGLRTFVDAAGVDASAIRRAGDLRQLFAKGGQDADWREPYLALTDDLAAGRAGAFRAMSSCHFGIGKGFFREIGGFDESFDRYGLEDTELAYPAQVRGGLLVPVRDARAWHQGRRAPGRESKRRALRRQRAMAEEPIAHPAYRESAPGRVFGAPRFVVTVAGDGPASADPKADLVVRIEVPRGASTADAAALRDRFRAHPRVRIAVPGAERRCPTVPGTVGQFGEPPSKAGRSACRAASPRTPGQFEDLAERPGQEVVVRAGDPLVDRRDVGLEASGRGERGARGPARRPGVGGSREAVAQSRRRRDTVKPALDVLPSESELPARRHDTLAAGLAAPAGVDVQARLLECADDVSASRGAGAGFPSRAAPERGGAATVDGHVERDGREQTVRQRVHERGGLFRQRWPAAARDGCRGLGACSPPGGKACRLGAGRDDGVAAWSHRSAAVRGRGPGVAVRG